MQVDCLGSASTPLAVISIWSRTMAHATITLAPTRRASTYRGGWISRAILAFELAMQVRRERRALRELSDAGLKDLGLTRSDVQGEAGRAVWDLPFERLGTW
jgi:uncharacterized protein YjiS (DUF1127 family)